MNAKIKVFKLIELFQSSRNRTGNILGLSVGQWLRYYGFLLILKQQYQELSSQHVQMSCTISERIEAGANVTDEFMKFSDLDLQVQLRVESFYLFSKILLDRTADSFNYCFNIEGSKSGSSFTKMQADFVSNCQNQDLIRNTTSFSEVRVWLQEHLIKDRNKRIEHATNPRLMHGFMPGPENTVMINRMVLYPSDLEDVATQYLTAPSKGLEELFQKIDLYLIEMVEFLKVNEEKIQPN